MKTVTSGGCGITKPTKNRCHGQNMWNVTEKQSKMKQNNPSHLQCGVELCCLIGKRLNR